MFFVAFQGCINRTVEDEGFVAFRGPFSVVFVKPFCFPVLEQDFHRGKFHLGDFRTDRPLKHHAFFIVRSLTSLKP